MSDRVRMSSLQVRTLSPHSYSHAGLTNRDTKERMCDLVSMSSLCVRILSPHSFSRSSHPRSPLPRRQPAPPSESGFHHRCHQQPPPPLPLVVGWRSSRCLCPWWGQGRQWGTAVDPTVVPVLRSETDRSILFLTLK